MLSTPSGASPASWAGDAFCQSCQLSDFRMSIMEVMRDEAALDDVALAAEAIACLPPKCRYVLRVLDDFQGSKGHCWPSMEYLTEETGIPVRTLYEMICTLKSIGAVTARRRGFGKSNLYQVNAAFRRRAQIARPDRQPIADQDRQPIADQDRQPIADQDRQPIADQDRQPIADHI